MEKSKSHMDRSVPCYSFQLLAVWLLFKFTLPGLFANNGISAYFKNISPSGDPLQGFTLDYFN